MAFTPDEEAVLIDIADTEIAARAAEAARLAALDAQRAKEKAREDFIDTTKAQQAVDLAEALVVFDKS